MGKQVAMVTGDNELAANHVAKQVGIAPEYPFLNVVPIVITILSRLSLKH